MCAPSLLMNLVSLVSSCLVKKSSCLGYKPWFSRITWYMFYFNLFIFSENRKLFLFPLPSQLLCWREPYLLKSVRENKIGAFIHIHQTPCSSQSHMEKSWQEAETLSFVILEPDWFATHWGCKKSVVCLTGLSVGEDKAHMPPPYQPLFLEPIFSCSLLKLHTEHACIPVSAGWKRHALKNGQDKREKSLFQSIVAFHQCLLPHYVPISSVLSHQSAHSNTYHLLPFTCNNQSCHCSVSNVTVSLE